MALITAAQARLAIPALTSTGEDANIDTIIARAGAIMATWCGYPAVSAVTQPTMESTTYTRYFDGPGGRDLHLDVWPVTAITSIYDDTTRDYTAAAYLVASADYRIDIPLEGRIVLTSTAAHGAWSTAKRAIKVVFTAGFVAATAPNDVIQAAVMTTKHLWDLRHHQGKTNVSAQGGASASLVDVSLLPPEAREALQAYRLPRVFL